MSEAKVGTVASEEIEKSRLIKSDAYLQDLLYLQIELERPSSSFSWGLSITFSGNSCLIVGSSDQNALNGYLRGIWAASILCHPILFQRNEMEVSAFTRYIMSLPYRNCDRSVVPGDLIVGLNGRSMGSFKSLKDATSVMVSSNRLSLIVARHPVARAAAQMAIQQALVEKANDGSSRASLASAKIFEGLHKAPTYTPKPRKMYPRSVPKEKVYLNPMFKEKDGKQLPYCDNGDESSPEGDRAKLFLSDLNDDNIKDWIRRKTMVWKFNYTWNKEKRRRLEETVEEHISLTDETFDDWLVCRKKQWRIQRRKRQRQANILSPEKTVDVKGGDGPKSPTSVVQRVLDPELEVIDAMLEEEEKRAKELKQRAPADISFLFDPSLECPDDVIIHCFRFMEPTEHCKLLMLSSTTRKGLASRENVWRQLCPSTWQLPRRPRKPWHELYITRLRDETEKARKIWDDLLAKVSVILQKGDQFQSIEKLVNEAERDHGYDINYTSGVVCERNSMLNLAIIHKRHKVARWLIEDKKADIESCDRGGFTALLNAAWAGDRSLVRLLMQYGADRSKLGKSHYTKPLAPPDFEGLTAAGWAAKRGFPEIATLIQMGL